VIARRAQPSLCTLLAAIAGTLASPCAPRAADVAAQQRGASLFETYCVLCHGSAGKGDGRAAALQKTPPANLTLSRRSSAYQREIVSKGGAAMKRSPSMPAWNEVLSSQQIADVVAYVRILADRESAAARLQP
jgi:mono/diheme cytochrome c family protein